VSPRSECIAIDSCPKCQGRHRYKLAVDRSIVIKMLTASDMYERARQVRFVRLFTCPVKKEDYQATFYLSDTSSDRIKDVRVVGIVSSDEQED